MKYFAWARAALIVGAFVSLGACSTTLKAASPDSGTGRLPTSTKLTAAEITIIEPFDAAKYGKLAYVKTDTKNPTLDKFWVDSITNTKVFGAVYDSDGLQKVIIQKYQSGGAPLPDFSDNLIGLHNAVKDVGPFLIIEPMMEWKGGYGYEASLKVTDPETTVTIFTAKKDAFNWAGLDGPLFYPLINSFIDWAQGIAPLPAAVPKASTPSAAEAPTAPKPQ